MGYEATSGGILIPTHAARESVAFAAGAASAPMGEVATIALGKDITRGYVDSLDLLPSQDHLLQLRGGGDLNIYREVLSDWQVRATIGQWAGAVVSKEWEVVPGRKRGQYSKARAKQAAESLEAMLRDLGGEDETTEGEQGQPIAGLDDVTEKLLMGRFWGYAVSECLYGRDGREIVLDRVKVKAPQRFAFAPTGALRLLTSADPLGEVLPRRKFWTYTTGAGDHDEPYGLGLAHFLYWPVRFKRQGMAFWLKFLEKFGQPTPIGHFPRNATPDQRSKLLAAIRAIQTDSGVILPEGMLIDLLEAARSGVADYAALCDRMDAAISKLVLGHGAVADATPGRLGGEDLAAGVRKELIRAGADLVCDSFNVGPSRWITAWNFGEDVPAPQLWRRIEGEPDLKPQAERDKIIVDLAQGRLRLREDYLAATYGDIFEPVTAGQPDLGAPTDASAGAVPPGAAPAADGEAAATKLDAQVLNAWSMGAERLVNLGLDIPQSFVREAFGLPAPAPGAAVLAKAAQTVQPTDASAGAVPPGSSLATQLAVRQPTASFSVAAFAAALDKLGAPGESELAALDQVATDQALQAAVDPMLTPLIEAAQRDPEGVLGQLAERYPEMDASALQDLLARLLFVAELWGRATAQADAMNQ